MECPSNLMDMYTIAYLVIHFQVVYIPGISLATRPQKVAWYRLFAYNYVKQRQDCRLFVFLPARFGKSICF